MALSLFTSECWLARRRNPSDDLRSASHMGFWLSFLNRGRLSCGPRPHQQFVGPLASWLAWRTHGRDPFREPSPEEFAFWESLGQSEPTRWWRDDDPVWHFLTTDRPAGMTFTDVLRDVVGNPFRPVFLKDMKAHLSPAVQ